MLSTPLSAPTTTKIAVGVAVVAGIYVLVKWRSRGKKRRDSPYVKDFKQGVVYLFQFPRMKAIPNMCPSCLKLETWLRIADIPYQNVEKLPISVRSKEGSLPFVEFNGVEYPDSSLAIRDLTPLTGKESMESHMGEEEKAAARAFEALAEHSLLMASIKFRVQYARELFELFPEGTFNSFILTGIAKIWTRAINRKLEYTGLGKHSDEDICDIAERDMLALSHQLRDQPYFTGDRPTKVDATVFSVLAQILYLPFDSPQQEFLQKECRNLVRFCERVKGEYWPDWSDCTEKFAMNTEWKLYRHSNHSLEH